MSLSSRSWENFPPCLLRPRLANTRNQSQLVFGILKPQSQPWYIIWQAWSKLLLLIDRIPQPVLDVGSFLCGHRVPYLGCNSQGKTCGDPESTQLPRYANEDERASTHLEGTFLPSFDHCLWDTPNTLGFQGLSLT